MVISSKFWEPPDAAAIVSGQTVVVFRLKNNSTNKPHKLLHACTVPPRPGFEFCLMKQSLNSDVTSGNATAMHRLCRGNATATQRRCIGSVSPAQMLRSGCAAVMQRQLAAV
jgi:hypothetical protein